MGVWTLLSAHALHKASEASPVGKRRSASLTVLGPIDALSQTLLLDRLAGVFQRAVGHDPNEVAPGGGGILADGPPPPRPPQPSVQPPVSSPGGSTGPGHQQGDGHQHGHGGNSNPSPHPTGSKPSGSGAKLPPLRVPTAANPLRVLVVGDSFAEGVDLGLSPVLDSHYVRVITKGLHSTGLSRPDYYNWPAALQSFMAQYHPDIVIVMLGGNDPQALRTLNGQVIPFGRGDRRWPQTYRERVGQFMDIASEGKTYVAWIGMPIMGVEAYSRNIRSLDDIYEAQAAAHPNVLYLDTWNLFADADGHYADYLPDRSGNLHLMRASDKIHFSSDGNQRMIHALIQTMKYRWKLSPRAIG
jgi:uncharacterized protein